MTRPLYITDDEIKSSLSFKEVVDVTELAFLDYEQQKSAMPEKVYLDLPQFKGDFRAMPAYSERYNIAAVKWINSHTDNPILGLPSVSGVMIANNPQTGELMAIIEATELTALRTGAAGAIAVKYMTPDKPLTVACIGCGKQALYQLECLLQVRQIDHINLFDLKQSTIQNILAKLDFKKPSISYSVCQDSVSCVANVDVIITTTPSTKPLVFLKDLLGPVHINAIGADAVGKQEIDHAIMKQAFIVVDDLQQAMHSGECNTGVSSGQLNPRHIKTSLGAIINKKEKIKHTSLSVFDSTGLAIQDVALAGYILEKKASK